MPSYAIILIDDLAGFEMERIFVHILTVWPVDTDCINEILGLMFSSPTIFKAMPKSIHMVRAPNTWMVFEELIRVVCWDFDQYVSY